MNSNLSQERRIPNPEGLVREGIQGGQGQEKADLESQSLGNQQVSKVILPQEKLTEKNCRTGNFIFFPLFLFLRSTGLVTWWIGAPIFPMEKGRMQAGVYAGNRKQPDQAGKTIYKNCEEKFH